MTALVTIRSPNGGPSPGAWRASPDEEIDRALDLAGLAAEALAVDDALRRAAIAAVAEAIAASRAELAALIIAEGGKRPDEAAAEVDYALGFLGDALRHADAPAEEVGEGRAVEPWPVGPALLITPFNDPLAGLARKIGPALAAGCPVLLKPSPLGMLVASRLVSAVPQPARGLIHLLAVPEQDRIARLVADPRVAIVSLTGSTAAGRAVAAAAAAGPKPAIMELGGNCPMVVLAGADLEAAAEAAVSRKLRAAGQACSAINRILVADTVVDAFRAHLCAAMAAARAGAPDDAGARYGPVRTAASAARLRDLAQRAVARGERLIHGDVPADVFADDEAFLVQPAILESPAGASVLDAEEAFGPLLSLQPVDTPRLSVRLRAERQPLAAYIFGPEADAGALARTLRFGSVGINTTAIQGTDVPTGGFGAAGFGREGGRWAVAGFRTTRNIRHARPGSSRGPVRRLSAPGVPASTSPVSNGTAAAGLVFVGGQMPRDPNSGGIVEGAEAQALLSLDHALAVAERAGARPADILLAIVYVTDLSAKPAVNAAFRARFGEAAPARNLVAVREIGEGAIVEVGLIARASMPC